MKTFTTAELLEKLNIGQRAEMIEPLTDVVVRQTSKGLIVEKDVMSSKYIGQPLPLSLTVLNAVWRLERKKLTFAEAVSYIRSGRKVSCEYKNQKPVYYDSLDDLIHIREVIDGHWYLED